VVAQEEEGKGVRVCARETLVRELVKRRQEARHEAALRRTVYSLKAWRVEIMEELKRQTPERNGAE
jgi:hypothetical protein